MVRMMNRVSPRDLMRWSIYAVFLGISISIAPDYWTAERLPRELLYVRAFTVFAPIVLMVMLYRARHASPLRQFPIMVGLVTIMLFEAALKIGMTGKIVALLIAWSAVVWVEWRRLADEEGRSA